MILNAERMLPVASIILWRPDMPVLDNRSDNDGSAIECSSIFSCDSWDLCYSGGKPTLTRRTISFARCTRDFKDTLKRIVWCMLNVETPIHLIERPNSARTRLSIGSAASHYDAELRPFVAWVAENGFACISDLTTEDIRRYGEEISQSSISRNEKARRLWGATRFWLYAPYLPHEDRLIQPPWEVDGTLELLGPANWSAENKTPPIHPQTMSPLIDWALRFITEFATDILSAIEEKQALLTDYRDLAQPGDAERFQEYISQILKDGDGIPGVLKKTGRLAVAYQYVAVKAKVAKNAISLNTNKLKNLTIKKGCPLNTSISGKINGALWIPYFDFYKVEYYRQLLVASCIIVVAYLSGMRSEELRALQRGCCKPVHLTGGGARYELNGLTFKDVLDDNGNAIPEGAIREHPWHVIKPVFQAIVVLEKLHSNELLFSESALNFVKTEDRGMALQSGVIADRIEGFIDWCNSSCDRLGVPELIIPQDIEGRVTLRRFRRTLGWFIYRLPGGRISLGIQYGHLRGMTTDGYGSRVSSGLRDVFPMEEAYAIADSLQEASDRLVDGEGVSGPSADKYVLGVIEFSETYQGRYLTPRQAATLSRNPSLRIIDNGVQAVACCYDVTKSLCHIGNSTKSDLKQTPDLIRCKSNCANIARTDKHIEKIKHDIRWQEEQANSKLTPTPLKERHLQRIASLKDIIRNHEKTRRTLSDRKA